MFSVEKELDGFEHHRFYCIDSKKFWLNLKSLMTENLNFGFEFNVCKVPLGFPNSGVPGTGNH